MHRESSVGVPGRVHHGTAAQLLETSWAGSGVGTPPAQALGLRPESARIQMISDHAPRWAPGDGTMSPGPQVKHPDAGRTPGLPEIVDSAAPA